jgi:hypothetical protein
MVTVLSTVVAKRLTSVGITQIFPDRISLVRWRCFLFSSWPGLAPIRIREGIKSWLFTYATIVDACYSPILKSTLVCIYIPPSHNQTSSLQLSSYPRAPLVFRFPATHKMLPRARSGSQPWICLRKREGEAYIEVHGWSTRKIPGWLSTTYHTWNFCPSGAK